MASMAIKRIRADVKELTKHASPVYYALPLEDNMFEWHFCMRGAPGTDFVGGVYHGRIILPTDWPFKAPDIILLTPNGRFETRRKICLSISAHHNETWQPAWGIRLILEALVSFMPSKGEGALASLDYTPAERQQLARDSHAWKLDEYGHPEVWAWAERAKREPLPADCGGEDGGAGGGAMAEQVAQLSFGAARGGGGSSGGSGAAASTAQASTAQAGPGVRARARATPAPAPGPAASAASPRPAPPAAARAGRSGPTPAQRESQQLLFAMVVVAALIVALLVRKALRKME
eukprot:g5351.t1